MFVVHGERERFIGGWSNVLGVYTFIIGGI